MAAYNVTLEHLFMNYIFSKAQIMDILFIYGENVPHYRNNHCSTSLG